MILTVLSIDTITRSHKHVLTNWRNNNTRQLQYSELYPREIIQFENIRFGESSYMVVIARWRILEIRLYFTFIQLVCVFLKLEVTEEDVPLPVNTDPAPGTHCTQQARTQQQYEGSENNTDNNARLTTTVDLGEVAGLMGITMMLHQLVTPI